MDNRKDTMASSRLRRRCFGFGSIALGAAAFASLGFWTLGSLWLSGDGVSAHADVSANADAAAGSATRLDMAFTINNMGYTDTCG